MTRRFLGHLLGTAGRCLLAGFTALALLVSVSGCALTDPTLAASGFQAARYVPAEAWLFSSLTLRPGVMQAANLRALAEAFGTSPDVNPVTGLLPDDDGVSERFEQLILPLLDGEVAVAGFGDPFVPTVLFLVHSSDPVALAQALAEGALEPVAEYKGAQVFVPVGGDLFLAATQSWLIASEDDELVRAALDLLAVDAGEGLAGQPRFQSVVERLPERRLAYLYVDTAPVLETLEFVAPVPPDATGGLSDGRGRVAFAVTAEREGLDIRIEAIMDEPDARLATDTGGDALQALERLPRSTLFAVSANDISTSFEDIAPLVSGLSASGDLPVELDEELAPGEEGPRLDQLFGGEVALGVTRGTLRPSGEGFPGAALVARVPDPAAAHAELERLAALLPPGASDVITVAGQMLRRIELLPELTLTYGILGDWLYVVSGDLEEVMAASAKGKGGGLGSNLRFAQVRSALNREGSNIFLDLQGAQELIEQLLPPSELAEFRDVQPLLRPLRALGGNVRADAASNIHGRIFVAIAPA